MALMLEGLIEMLRSFSARGSMAGFVTINIVISACSVVCFVFGIHESVFCASQLANLCVLRPPVSEPFHCVCWSLCSVFGIYQSVLCARTTSG